MPQSTSDTLLFAAGECDKSLPTPALERHYVFYATAPIFFDDTHELKYAPPLTAAAILPRLVGLLGAGSQTPAEILGGIPVNVGRLATSDVWKKPLLPEVRISDLSGLVQTSKVTIKNRSYEVQLENDQVASLATTGTTLARMAKGGLVRLRLNAQPRSDLPILHKVDDIGRFLANPQVPMRDGTTHLLRLSKTDVTAALSGKPIVFRRGSSYTVVMPAGDPAPLSAPAAVAPPGDTTPLSITPMQWARRFKRAAPPPPPPPQLALLIPFDQAWRLESYERGEVISSIALTPLEEMTIEVFNWDRRKTSLEDTTASEAEQTAESQSVDRDTRDVFGELTKQGTFTWGLHGDFGGAIADGVSLGGSAGGSDSVTSVARNTRQQVQENTLKSTTRVKSSRQTKITESTETGSETRTTRKLRNPNQTYPITYNYFQILARYSVDTICLKDDLELVITVDNPLSQDAIDVDFVRQNEKTLRRALLDPGVAAGFDAARTLWMRERACEELCRECRCSPAAGATTTVAYATAQTTVKALAAAVQAMESNLEHFRWDDVFAQTVAVPGAPPAQASPTAAQIQQVLFVDALNTVAPSAWGSLVGALPAQSGDYTPANLVTLSIVLAAIDGGWIDKAVSPDDALKSQLTSLITQEAMRAYAGQFKAALDSYLASVANLTIDDILTATPGSVIGAIGSLLEIGLGVVAAALDPELVVIALITVVLGGVQSAVGATMTNDGGIKGLLQAAKEALTAWIGEQKALDKDAQTAATQAAAERQANFEALFPAAKILAARERFDALVRHIEANRNYYSYAILSDRIGTGQYDPPASIKQLFPYAVPQPKAIVGGKLCFPLGSSSNPAFKPLLKRVKDAAAQIVNDGTPSIVKLPTPGYTVEPKLSMCSAGEPFVEEARAIELDLRRAEAKKAEAEAKRRDKRLAQTPPNLDPFEPTSASLQVDVKNLPSQ